MPERKRANLLALAVLICLYERPMHPYEVATVLRQRNKHESVRLNYGSLYAVVDSLERRGLIAAQETERAGRLPERTIYRLTEAGGIEMQDWLTELISTPQKEYPAFEAALAFLPALPPDQALILLEERANRLETDLTQANALRELLGRKHGLFRLVWLEAEFATALRRAELDYLRRLIEVIRTGRLEGIEWWRQIHEHPDEAPTPPQFPIEDALKAVEQLTEDVMEGKDSGGDHHGSESLQAFRVQGQERPE